MTDENTKEEREIYFGRQITISEQMIYIGPDDPPNDPIKLGLAILQVMIHKENEIEIN